MCEWRPIRGFEGLYEVSNEGRVRSIRYSIPRLLKINKTKNGYVHVGLVKFGVKAKTKRFWYSVHRLVASAFIGECPDGYTVNHKDENKENNRVENLEYITLYENANYGTARERASEKLSKKIVRIDRDGNEKVFSSAKSASMEMFGTGSKAGVLTHCAGGFAYTAYGYKWRYAS